MCGIAGVVQIQPGKTEPISDIIANNMLHAIRRRGPDGESQWRSDDRLCWLGHRRLAIIDLDMGEQPMTNEDGTIWIVFNGEIYNYKLLRSELLEKGHKFKTSSDTEVLIHGFEQWGGDDLVRRLRGIFAFALYDTKRRHLFLARDHMGVKPLHWWTDGETFMFASEIKSLISHPKLHNRRVNVAGIAQFLVTRYVSRPNTIIEDINRLPEGHYMEVEIGKCNKIIPKQYWDVHYNIRTSYPGYEEAHQQLDTLLKESVEMQLMSDVPLGAQLSGGVDSSVVVALMEIIRQKTGDRNRVKTFSVGFDIEKYNEFHYARAIANRYNTDHHEIHVSFNDFVDELAHLCWIYDEPMGEAPGIPTYLMCKNAIENVSVMLCGEGADEQFGGYRKYIFDQLSQYLSWIPSSIRKSLMRGTGKLMPYGARRVRSILEILALSEKSERFASWYGALDTELQSNLLNPEIGEQVADVFLKDTFNKLIEQCDSNSMFNQFCYCDNHSRLVDTLLVKADRMSMGAGIESRVPLIDPFVVEYAASLPPDYKVKGLQTKRILKKMAEQYVPHELIYRRKIGFAMPLTDWLAGPLSNLVKDILLSDQCLSRGYYKPDVLTKIVEEHISQKVDREQGIWVLLALELWHRIYIDDDGTEMAAERLKEVISRSSFVAA